MSAEDDRARDGLRHNPFAKHFGKASPVPPDVPAKEPEPISAQSRLPAPRPHAGPPLAPSKDRIVVRRERKGHGGKAVTIVEGPGLSGHDLDALARGAAKALGAGARVEHGALVVQGEQTERLIAWLGTRGFESVVRGN
jgi:translation initiation factor 1